MPFRPNILNLATDTKYRVQLSSNQYKRLRGARKILSKIIRKLNELRIMACTYRLYRHKNVLKIGKNSCWSILLIASSGLFRQMFTLSETLIADGLPGLTR